MIRILFLFLSVALISNPALATPAAAEVSSQIDAAQALYEQAMLAENSWVMTPRLIDQARQALASGDVSAAAALAARAYRSAEASVAQVEREKLAWRGRVPTN